MGMELLVAGLIAPPAGRSYNFEGAKAAARTLSAADADAVAWFFEDDQDDDQDELADAPGVAWARKALLNAVSALEMGWLAPPRGMTWATFPGGKDQPSVDVLVAGGASYGDEPSEEFHNLSLLAACDSVRNALYENMPEEEGPTPA